MIPLRFVYTPPHPINKVQLGYTLKKRNSRPNLQAWGTIKVKHRHPDDTRQVYLYEKRTVMTATTKVRQLQ